MGILKPTQKDVALSKRFKKLSPGQVAMCRGHLESVILQYIYLDDSALESAKRDKTNELSRLHGSGFGEYLWTEAAAQLSSLFTGKEKRLNKGAWQSMVPE